PRPTPTPTLFPYTTLFRSLPVGVSAALPHPLPHGSPRAELARPCPASPTGPTTAPCWASSGLLLLEAHPARARCGRPLLCACGRSEEHTSELQSRFDLVCR